MKLKAYLVQIGMTQDAFAEKIGRNRSNVSRFCSGQRRPDLTTLQRIYEATDGNVRPEDFFTEPEKGEAA